MKPFTVEWVEKAEGDYSTMSRESQAARSPNHDAVCFHAQQCAEKYLKAWLVERGITPPRTHSLDHLLNELSAGGAPRPALELDALFLDSHAFSYRYPGASADQVAAVKAVAAAEAIRAEVRSALGLDA